MEQELVIFALALAGFITAAKLAGYLSARLHQPVVFGELLAGLLLGPSLLNVLEWDYLALHPKLDVLIEHLAFLGVLFLMFLAGLEVELEAMRRAGKVAVWSGLLGSITPVVVAYGVFAYLFDFTPRQAVFLGLVMGATSVSISAQTLMELGVLRTPVGLGLLGAAVVDDVLVILLLSFFVAFAGAGVEGPSLVSLIVVVARMLLFFVIAWALGSRFIPRLTHWANRLPVSESLMAFAIVIMMVYAWAAEAGGHVAAITGAFLAGLLFARTPYRARIERGVASIAYAWLVPLFFINIGLQTDLSVLFTSTEGRWEALVLVLLAILTKVLGCGLGARLGGLGWMDALRLGVGMTSRGEVGLIVASVGIGLQALPASAFAAVVLMVVVTTLITPVALRLLYPRTAAATVAGSEAEETPENQEDGA